MPGSDEKVKHRNQQVDRRFIKRHEISNPQHRLGVATRPRVKNERTQSHFYVAKNLIKATGSQCSNHPFSDVQMIPKTLLWFS